MRIVGIDGGGTKTIYSLCDENGYILASSELGTIALPQCGEEGMRRGLLEGIASVSKEAPDAICFGIPCYGESVQRDIAIRRICAEIAAKSAHVLCNDAEVAWAGSFALQPGINIVAGTGTIAYGVDSQGTSARCGGWGSPFSDEGSGFWLGMRLLALFCKQSDGRIPERGPLYALVREQFQLENDFEIIDILEADYLPYRNKVASLQRTLLAAAKAGDESALAAYDEAGREIALNILGILHKLNFSDDIAISYSGGIFNVGDIMMRSFTKALEGSHCRLQKPKAPPWAGALMLGLRCLSLDTESALEQLTLAQ